MVLIPNTLILSVHVFVLSRVSGF